MTAEVRAVRHETGAVVLVDQRALPEEWRELRCTSADEVATAIADMVVRGAPAIGVAAAYGVALEAWRARGEGVDAARAAAERAAWVLERARPTAVNLSAAVHRMRRAVMAGPADEDAASLVDRLDAEARGLEQREREASLAMGRHAADLLPRGARVLVHCNTGALAAPGDGTALAGVREAHRRGVLDLVYVGETRPRLQGARLTAWELVEAGIPHLLVVDSLAPTLMLHRAVDAVLVGADRVAANGDVANKVGTYALAVACAHHDVPLYVVAPTTTLDTACESGADIPIEGRAPEEVTTVAGHRITPAQTRALNPAFDVTPASMVTALVTERGVAAPVTAATVAALLE